jgi:GrpE
MTDDIFEHADEQELAAPPQGDQSIMPPWPDETTFGDPIPAAPLDRPEPDQASPFSVAVATVAGMTGVRALRDAWRRRRTEEAAAARPPAREPLRAPRPAPAPERATERMPRERQAMPEMPDRQRLDEERAALVELCIELDDLLTNEAMREKLRRGLRRIGVEAVEPEGARFDPEIHRAIGTATAPEANREGIIARVERAGFRDGGVELRPPEVIVYSSERADRGD